MNLGRKVKAAVLLLSFTAVTPAFAAHNHPVKAKKMKVPLVRAYEDCNPPHVSNDQHNVPLTFPACSPSLPLNTADFAFGTGGSGSITISLVGGPDIKVIVKLKKVLQNGSPFSGTLYLTATLRITDHNCQNIPGDDCTMTDTTGGVFIPVSCNNNGTCSAVEEINAFFGPGGSFPIFSQDVVVPGTEANIEVRDLQISDITGGNAIFVPGLYVE